MRDPVQGEGAERELFAALGKLCDGKPRDMLWSVAVNLIVDSIRQITPRRKDAEQTFDRLLAQAKTLLLDVHYDPVTGRRRTVVPFTQVAQMPFHVNENVIYRG